MNVVKYIPLIMLLPVIGYADKKPQFVLEVVKAVQTEQARSYYIPGTPSQSRTTCNGTSNDHGTTSTLNADCATTTTPGSAPYSGTRFSYSEDMRVIMPDGSHLTLWCQQGFRRCIHLAPRKYWAEQEKDTVWIYCTYADQERWDETGMSPGERKANHEVQRIKYRVVGTWNEESKNVEPIPSEAAQSESKGLDPGLLAWSTLTNDTSAAGASFDLSMRVLKADEVRCGEPWFGEALICKVGDRPTIVGIIATRPSQEIYHYWLEKISDDFIEFKRISALDCKDKCADVAEFVRDSEQAYHKDGSVWLKLKAAYCKEVLSGTYPDLNGNSKRCGD
jgi:hypothetical protein